MKRTQHAPARSGNLVLGLDIGAASVGWALVEYSNGQPTGLKAAGVRTFPAGVEGDAGAIASGRDVSRAVKRREARSRRRLLARRRHRLTKLARILQGAALLPAGDLDSADALGSYFPALDRQLFPLDARRANPHLLPYKLRARALDEPLSPHELGRALYHLAQRRGFLSNRRVKPKPAGVKQSDEEKEEGIVKAAIGELAERIEDAGARTLGEYLSRLDPEQERVRNRYLSRGMLLDEFEAIWTAQRAHHPAILTDDLKEKVHRAIFFQRPLKSARHLIGKCDLEKGKRRAPLACLSAQRFRLLQKVNDLQLFLPDGEVRDLTPEERARLLDALQREGDRTFGAVRRLLKLPRGSKFNFETEGEKGLIGNRTARKLADVFGEDRWAAFPPEERERIVNELRSLHNRDALKRRAMKLWRLDEEAAERLASVALEDGYCNLSRQALAKVLPLMEEGMQYATARKQLYGDQPGPRRLLALPRLETALEVRNPAVERALTELRRVVNAIVREHGLPAYVRIELARDLKRNRKDRKEISLRNAKNRKGREEAARKIIAEAGIPNPRRSDIEKWLLADECGWQCPYTGKQISVESLFGDHPQFDIEHIIPFDRCLDNSFMNKTLCEVAENRTRKGNRTPHEAYAHDEENRERIIARVKQFSGRSGRVKLERFQSETVPGIDDFATSQLNDTRYASKLASEYVGLLYGAAADGVDPDGTRRVQAGRGAVTAFLRDEWGLNSILGGGEKTREDHRQHAIDAVVTALTTPAAIKRLSDAAARAPEARRRRFAPVEPPWPGFLEDVRAVVGGCVVSHRAGRKVAGALHNDLSWSPRRRDSEGREWVHQRKPLARLSPREVASIVDDSVRQCVQAKLDELGIPDPKEAFKSENDHPALLSTPKRESGPRPIPIHSVRIRKPDPTVMIGKGVRRREVMTESNHHIEVIETTSPDGKPKWQGRVVTVLDAMHRLRSGQPVVQRDHGAATQFKFSLTRGEIIELDAEQGKKELYVVQKITTRGKGKGERCTVGIVGINDARPSTGKDKHHVRDLQEPSPDVLRKRRCRKVLVTPLGEVRRAGD
ncbi:MAG TPA: type II CRISPR RNA-guided endonuclease Cas9 [Armatimonadota bacterium]|nr:type II CRISPR RNA-guided endonuclease Cas9 [Armatimonadota bacterium]